MTTKQFDRIASEARLQGKLIYDGAIEPCSSNGENEHEEIFEFEGFNVIYRDGEFLTLEDATTKEVIKRGDCTEYRVDDMTNEELEQLVKDAQKVIDNRQKAEARKAIREFETAWKKLQMFGEVRMRVSATGESHFHSTVDKMRISILPF